MRKITSNAHLNNIATVLGIQTKNFNLDKKGVENLPPLQKEVQTVLENMYHNMTVNNPALKGEACKSLVDQP